MALDFGIFLGAVGLSPGHYDLHWVVLRSAGMLGLILGPRKVMLAISYLVIRRSYEG
jgi:hypothetical protein